MPPLYFSVYHEFYLSLFPVYTHRGKKECQQCAEGLGCKERYFQNWFWALLHAAKQESFYERPQAPSQSHCCHTPHCLPPVGVCPLLGGCSPKLRSDCWPECQGVLSLPRERREDQLLLSPHTSLRHTSPGRMNRFLCVLNSAFSLFPNLLLIHVFSDSQEGGKKAISTILSQDFWFYLGVTEEKGGIYKVYELRRGKKNPNSVYLRSHNF